MSPTYIILNCCRILIIDVYYKALNLKRTGSKVKPLKIVTGNGQRSKKKIGSVDNVGMTIAKTWDFL